MAHIYPKDFPYYSHQDGIMAEKAIFEFLKFKVSDDFHCFYRVRVSRKFDSMGQDREVDFLIVHKNHGIFSLEVKSGLIECTASGIKQRRRTDQLKLDQGRDLNLELQMRDTTQALRRWLKEDSEVRTFINEFAFFPDTYRHDANVTPDWNAKSLFKDDLHGEKFQEFFKHNIVCRHEAKLEEKQFNDIVAFFKRSYGGPARASLSESLLTHLDAINEITADIAHRFADHYYDDESLAVVGGAGSGKTKFLLKIAKATADKGRKVLVTCFNDLIEADLKLETRGIANIETLSIHRICEAMIKRAGVSLKAPPQAGRAEIETYYEETLPNDCLSAIKNLSEENKYDAIFVDEGQDFTINFWLVIRSLFKKNTEQLIVAFDPSQRARENVDPINLDEIFGEIKFHTAKMVYNLRNTKAIASYSGQFFPEGQGFAYRGRERKVLPLASWPNYSDGAAVVEVKHHLNSGPKVLEKLTEILDELVHKNSIECSKITVLTNLRSDDLKLETTSLHFGIALKDLLLVRTPIRENEICLETVRRFKGKENVVVIVLDSGMSKELKYIATTRATTLLYVLDCSKAKLVA